MTVSQMTIGEFKAMLTDVVSDIVTEKLSEYADPDHGLELREDFVERLMQQDERLKNGTEKLISGDDVFREYGLIP